MGPAGGAAGWEENVQNGLADADEGRRTYHQLYSAIQGLPRIIACRRRTPLATARG